jgi:hypothetical protein
MRISDIAAAVTGEGIMGKYTGGDDRPSRHEIRHLAYQLYEARG